MSKQQPTERQRTGGIKPKAKLDLSDLLAGKLGVTLSLSVEDRELISTTLVENIKEMSEKVDYRWKVTQGIMVVGLILATADKLISYI